MDNNTKNIFKGMSLLSIIQFLYKKYTHATDEYNRVCESNPLVIPDDGLPLERSNGQDGYTPWELTQSYYNPNPADTSQYANYCRNFNLQSEKSEIRKRFAFWIVLIKYIQNLFFEGLTRERLINLEYFTPLTPNNGFGTLYTFLRDLGLDKDTVNEETFNQLYTTIISMILCSDHFSELINDCCCVYNSNYFLSEICSFLPEVGSEYKPCFDYCPEYQPQDNMGDIYTQFIDWVLSNKIDFSEFEVDVKFYQYDDDGDDDGDDFDMSM